MFGAHKRLSEKQERILRFLHQFLEEHSYPPSIRDIQQGCDVSSTSVVDYNLRILEREGHIRRSPEISRGIELLGRQRETQPAFQTVGVPVLGYIAAGEPIPSYAAESWASDPMETLELPASWLDGRGEVYALKVKGQSMIDALIDDGDTVVVQRASEARDGETVVAWLKAEQEATLKRFYHEGGRVRLQPANSQMAPIYADPRNVEVQGKVLGVIRLLR
ncbi:MAG: transcriptional repressor LexA [Chloroflexi bacterium]|nr:transcriptional repressor LexA [Chloroflexota bacterium]